LIWLDGDGSGPTILTAQLINQVSTRLDKNINTLLDMQHH